MVCTMAGTADIYCSSRVVSLGYCFQTLMEYHLKLFDVRVGANWIHKTKAHWELSRNDPGYLIRKLKGRVRGGPDLLNEVLGIRKKVKGRGVPVYYIRHILPSL
jgi:hypothetical protein